MRRSALPLALLLLLAAVLPARAQSAGDVLSSALSAWEDRMEDIRDYSITHRVMGIESVTYFERVEDSDGPVYTSRSWMRMGGQTMEAPESDEPWNNPYELFPILAESARYEGEERVDGARTAVLVIEDVTALDLELAPDEPGDGEFQPGEGRFWVDPDRGVLRRMRIAGTFEDEGRTADMTVTVHLHDYEEREGLYEPGRVVIETSGLDQTLTPEERQQARASLEQMRAQLERMPEEQRAQMESMMAGQMAQLEQVLDSGTIEVEMELVDVTVNEGPPAGP